MFRGPSLLNVSAAGTHAFAVLGNILAAPWPPQALQTQDVDVAIAPVGIVLPQGTIDIPDALAKLDMGFLPVPPLDHKKPSTSFKIRGHPLRVDILTPQSGHEIKVIFLSQFNTGASGLPYLDYLLEETVEGGIVGADGILVRVPFPARFAFHKLLVSQVRAGAHLIRTSKDILQAAQVFAVLAQERPGDIDLAWDAVCKKGKQWVGLVRRGLQALSRQFPETYRDVTGIIERSRLNDQ